MSNSNNPMCCNCLYGGQPFKLGNVTHQHCEHPRYTQEGAERGDFTPYDTLMKFSETCTDHKFNVSSPPVKE